MKVEELRMLLESLLAGVRGGIISPDRGTEEGISIAMQFAREAAPDQVLRHSFGLEVQ